MKTDRLTNGWRWEDSREESRLVDDMGAIRATVRDFGGYCGGPTAWSVSANGFNFGAYASREEGKRRCEAQCGVESKS